MCLGKGLADGLDHTSIVNFTKQQKEFCLRFHFNGVNSYIFVNGVERHKLKAKVSEIYAPLFSLGDVLQLII